MYQSLSLRRGRLIVRCLVIVSIVAVSAAIFALPAAADKPTKSEFSFSVSSDINDVCSFQVTQASKVSITEIDFFDASGNLTRIDLHFVEQDTFTANGKILFGLPYAFNDHLLFDSSGNVTQEFSEGVVEKVPLPDGSLFVSAGRIDWVDHPGAAVLLSPDMGNPGDVARFCATLAP